MPIACCIVDCPSIYCRPAKVLFFCIPSVQTHRSEEIKILTEKRRNAWLRVIKRDLSENEKKYGRICEKHFLSGRPAALEDENNPDWVPCQNLGYKFGCALKRKSALDRFERLRKKAFRNIKQIHPTVESNKTKNGSSQQDDEIVSLKGLGEQSSIENHKYSDIVVGKEITQGEKVQREVNDTLNVSIGVQTERHLLETEIVQTKQSFSKEAIVQTDLTSLQLALCFNDTNCTNSLILQLKSKSK